MILLISVDCMLLCIHVKELLLVEKIFSFIMYVIEHCFICQALRIHCVGGC
jgi:hypothetical protein